MDRRTRICLWIIVLGLGNFVAYTIAYMFIGGDAMNGYVRTARVDGQVVRHYWLSRGGQGFTVPGPVWIYSAVHSLSVWLTVGAVLLAMLTLAKDRIVSSMRATVVRGRTFMTILATLIVFITVVITAYFILHIVTQLTAPQPAQAAVCRACP